MQYPLTERTDTWIVIDPKGVIGELAFEVGAFLLTRSLI